jgi:imidazolonepropionase-like amidohydrolase
MILISELKLSLLVFILSLNVHAESIAVAGETVHTMSGESITNGYVLLKEGKIERVGTGDIPDGYRVIRAQVVTPGLIDARGTVGLSGILNQAHDQEQLEKSAPLQPDLRAIDSYNPRDPLVKWVRDLGVTTVHACPSPGALISGQSLIVKTYPENVDQALLKSPAMIIATLGGGATPNADKAPGTRSKAVAMLRAELIKAREYTRKRQNTDEEKKPARDLKLEALAQVLEGKLPMLITTQRHHDILAALRLAEEFKFRPILDGLAEGYLLLDQIKTSGLSVILHPTMLRASGENENLGMETAAKLRQAGIPFAIQSGYETYVPKTRIILFEAALAAAHGLSPRAALASITIDAARILGLADRIGSLEPGKDADLALFDGDPLEYTTHCTTVIISGEVVSTTPR